MISIFRKIKYVLVEMSTLSLPGLSAIILLFVSLFSLMKTVPYIYEYNLKEMLIIPVSQLVILFISIFFIYKKCKKIMSSRMSYYENKKNYKSFSHYLEKNNIGKLSGRMEYECYLDYQDTRLFYENGFMVGRFKNRYALNLSEINTPELINRHALEFSKAIENESDTYNLYLKKRFISIAAAFHCIPIKRLYR